VQWLEHSQKDKCEWCDHKFNFHPLYAPDAPEKLPMGKVLQSCVRRAATEWIPFVARILVVRSLALRCCL
jgi:E3 ubiquitin-protein ligase MARCH6